MRYYALRLSSWFTNNNISDKNIDLKLTTL